MLRRLLDSPWTYFTLAGALALVAVASQFQLYVPSRPMGSAEDLAGLRERKPNLVFILVDTLRADRLQAYGYERPTSPILADLADFGVRFERVEAQSSWTKTSMASLWTGNFPTRAGVLRFADAIPEQARLPAEIFQEAGYATAGIWRNGWVGPLFGFHQGFDTYFRPVPQREPAKFQKRTPGANPLAGTDEDVTRAAISFLDTHGHEPFFLYLHYMDTHQYAYDGAAAALGFGTSLSDAYDASIHWIDRNIGTVVAALEERGLLTDTIVAIASDHGEAFGEHGHEGHARDLHREVIEVPLILALPFRVQGGVVVEPLVSNVDIWPTLLDLVGLSPLPDADGRSLVPAIEAAARGEPSRDVPQSHAYLDRNWGNDNPSKPIASVREGDLRMILTTESEGRTLELFDLASDRDEQHNLVETRSTWADRMLPAIERALATHPAWEMPVVEIDEMSRDLLRALGYVVK